MDILVVVDVQREFNKFIQYDLVDEIDKYARKFKAVYQIWDSHKCSKPTYKFPNEIKSVEKLFGKNHFNDTIKKYTDEIKNRAKEGTVLKLSDNSGYVVRVDNNHDWFFVNPDIVDLINEIKGNHVILIGGADDECLEDVYIAFKAFGLDVEKNMKFVYSAKTSNKQSIKDTFYRIKKYHEL